ncbi:ArsR family transcriptional regulator [bacterium]|nr:MAG: ArsR family transcriptional regulator [bacterium]
MEPESFQRIAKALADPQRFALLERIAREPEVACMALVGEFDITQATISHHLKELGAAGLIDCRREGKCCHFKLRSQTFAEYQNELARRVPIGKPKRLLRK